MLQSGNLTGLMAFTLAGLRCWLGAAVVPWASLLMPAGLVELLLLPRAEGVSTSNNCLLFCSSYSSLDFLAGNESDLLGFWGQSSCIVGGSDAIVALELAHRDQSIRGLDDKNLALVALLEVIKPALMTEHT